MMSKKSPFLFLIALVASLLVSCGSSKNTATVRYTSASTSKNSSKGGGRGDTRTFENPKSLPPQSNALLDEARRWIGTPYKYGGEDKRGVDCSGLVLNVYRAALDIKLPRSSREQASYCSPLHKNQLMPGDLIFFATGSSKTVSHVGIYVGDGRMIHSSTSGGVVVSDIESDYYVRTYAGAGSVDKYRAMISKSAPKVPSPTDSGLAESKKSKENHKDKTTDPDPSPAPAVTASAQPVPYKMTPVTSLPQRTTPVAETNNKPSPSVVSETPAPVQTVKSDRQNPTVKVTPVSETKPVTTVIATVSSDSPKANPETSAEEARKAVLNSLIEQKMDSIFKK